MTEITKLLKCISLWDKRCDNARIVIYSDQSGFVEVRTKNGVEYEPEYDFDNLEELFKETFRRWPIEEDGSE